MADPVKKNDAEGPGNLLRRLIDDSILVASFGQRAGLLGGGELFSAIQAVEAEENIDWSSKKIVSLQSALSNAINTINPVTLVDLRRGWDPFSETGPYRKLFNIFRFVYVLMAVLLITTAVHYSQWLKRAEAVVLLQEQDLAGQLDTMIHGINDNYLTVGETDGNTIFELGDGPALATLREKLRAAQRLNSARMEAQREYVEIIKRSYLVSGIVIGGDISRLWADYKLFDLRSKVKNSGPPPITNANPCADIADAYAKASMNIGSADPATSAVLDETINKPAVQLDKFGNIERLSKFNRRISDDEVGLQVLRCLVGANLAIAGVKYDDADLKQKIETVALWVLPALFGAFGAVVYHLRACWNRLRPDPRFGRAMLRVFLGAFGGIAFGWFWSPAGASEFLPQTLPLGAYAIAFLIGYSIDIFFSLLDRLVSAVSGAINNIGGDKPKMPAD